MPISGYSQVYEIAPIHETTIRIVTDMDRDSPSGHLLTPLTTSLERESYLNGISCSNPFVETFGGLYPSSPLRNSRVNPKSLGTFIEIEKDFFELDENGVPILSEAALAIMQEALSQNPNSRFVFEIEDKSSGIVREIGQINPNSAEDDAWYAQVWQGFVDEFAELYGEHALATVLEGLGYAAVGAGAVFAYAALHGTPIGYIVDAILIGFFTWWALSNGWTLFTLSMAGNYQGVGRHLARELNRLVYALIGGGCMATAIRKIPGLGRFVEAIRIAVENKFAPSPTPLILVEGGASSSPPVQNVIPFPRESTAPRPLQPTGTAGPGPNASANASAYAGTGALKLAPQTEPTLQLLPGIAAESSPLSQASPLSAFAPLSSTGYETPFFPAVKPTIHKPDRDFDFDKRERENKKILEEYYRWLRDSRLDPSSENWANFWNQRVASTAGSSEFDPTTVRAQEGSASAAGGERIDAQLDDKERVDEDPEEIANTIRDAVEDHGSAILELLFAAGLPKGVFDESLRDETTWNLAVLETFAEFGLQPEVWQRWQALLETPSAPLPRVRQKKRIAAVMRALRHYLEVGREQTYADRIKALRESPYIGGRKALRELLKRMAHQEAVGDSGNKATFRGFAMEIKLLEMLDALGIPVHALTTPHGVKAADFIFPVGFPDGTSGFFVGELKTWVYGRGRTQRLNKNIDEASLQARMTYRSVREASKQANGEPFRGKNLMILVVVLEPGQKLPGDTLQRIRASLSREKILQRVRNLSEALVFSANFINGDGKEIDPLTLNLVGSLIRTKYPKDGEPWSRGGEFAPYMFGTDAAIEPWIEGLEVPWNDLANTKKQ